MIILLLEKTLPSVLGQRVVNLAWGSQKVLELKGIEIDKVAEPQAQCVRGPTCFGVRPADQVSDKRRRVAESDPRPFVQHVVGAVIRVNVDLAVGDKALTLAPNDRLREREPNRCRSTAQSHTHVDVA